jgi:hypothetical protein
MARTPKDDPSTQEPSTYNIIDTRCSKDGRDGSAVYRKSSALQEQFLKAAVTKLTGFRMVESFTTVDVTGHPYSDSNDIEVTFTCTYVCRPSSIGIAKDVCFNRGIPYPQPREASVE